MAAAINKPKVEHDNVPRILVPEEVGFDTAAEYCAKKHEEESATFPFAFEIEALPYEGAFALANVLSQFYSATRDVNTFNPMRELGGFEKQVPSALGEKLVWWGRWNIAGLGYTWPGVSKTQDGNLVFTLSCKAPRRLRAKVEGLFTMLREEISKHQLYAGVALLLKPGDDGNIDLMTPPKVISLPQLEIGDLFLNAETTQAIKAGLFTAITEAKRLVEQGQKIRRGVMLAGPPGTGKSMCSTIAARLAIKQGWAVFYLTDASAFEQALSLAQAHEPALLVVEDVDRKLSGDRTAEIDRILNALSGISGDKKVIIVCTSNDASDLPAPMLRPGRLDLTVFFEAPDGVTAGKLLRKYLGKHTPEDNTLVSEIGALCTGMLPAFIEEVARRSILFSITRGSEDGVPDRIDMKTAAHGVRRQQIMLEEREKAKFRMPKTEIRVVTDTPPEQRTLPGTGMDGGLAKEVAAAAVAVLREAASLAKAEAIEGIKDLKSN